MKNNKNKVSLAEARELKNSVKSAIEVGFNPNWSEIPEMISGIYEKIKAGKAIGVYDVCDLVELFISEDVVDIDFWYGDEDHNNAKIKWLTDWLINKAAKATTWKAWFKDLAVDEEEVSVNKVWDGVSDSVDLDNIGGRWFNTTNNEGALTTVFVSRNYDVSGMIEQIENVAEEYSIKINDGDLDGIKTYDDLIDWLESTDIRFVDTTEKHHLLKKYDNVDFSKTVRGSIYGFCGMGGYSYNVSCFAYVMLKEEAWKKIKTVADIKALIKEVAEEDESCHGGGFVGKNNTDVIEYYTRLFLCIENAVTGSAAFYKKYNNLDGFDFIPENINLPSWLMYDSEEWYNSGIESYWRMEELIKAK